MSVTQACITDPSSMDLNAHSPGRAHGHSVSGVSDLQRGWCDTCSESRFDMGVISNRQVCAPVLLRCLPSAGPTVFRSFHAVPQGGQRCSGRAFSDDGHQTDGQQALKGGDRKSQWKREGQCTASSLAATDVAVGMLLGFCPVRSTRVRSCV